MSTQDPKITALYNLLKQDNEDLELDELDTSLHDENIVEYYNEEYLVLTDEEANEYVNDYVKDTLWAFNPDFLAYYMHESINSEILRVLQEKCEHANGALLQLVGDRFEDLVNDAILSDGRGHFMSSYDGYEQEIELNGEYYYIYRIN